MPARRAGVTVSLRGAEHPWGWWKPEWDKTQNQFVNRSGMQMDRLERVAAPIFHMYRAVIEKHPGVIVPQPDVRVTNVRRGQRELVSVREALTQIEHDLAKWKTQTFVPFNYHKANAPNQTFAARQELRSIFRTLNTAERAQALGDEAFVAAVLEMPAAASGMTTGDRDLLLRMVLEQKFPEQLAIAAEGEEAIETARISARAADVLFGNELQELGQMPIEAPPPEFAATFAA